MATVRNINCLLLALTCIVALIGITLVNQPSLLSRLNVLPSQNIHDSSSSPSPLMRPTALRSIMTASINSTAKPLLHAKITPHRSGSRGHSDHGWLNTYHTFSFADWYDPSFVSFGALRVLNEDRVRPRSGFPTHPHRDFEIFSYVLSGELTHRDSLLRGGEESEDGDRFHRMRRGDVQFTTGGTGIAHSELNEHDRDTVHFLQIWVAPWKKGLRPRYHSRHFGEEEEAGKRGGFVTVLSPLKGGPEATAEEEAKAEPTVEGTIPIHADFAMGAGIIAPGREFRWTVGGEAGTTEANARKVYVHLPMTKGGKAKVRLGGREDVVLGEGDGAFVEGVFKGDKLGVESVGEAEAEVVVLDTA